MKETIHREQRRLCAKYGSPWICADDDLKVGISPIVRSGLLPLNGLRHPEEAGTCGWYFWAGQELSSDPDFFVPVHVSHLKDWCPALLVYLGLAPGWRFLIADGWQDVWYDSSLLDI